MSDEPEVTKVQEISIETVVRLEAEAEQRVSPTDRISEAIGSFAGTNYFILLQLACVSVWLLMNTGALRVVSAFDPYPFPLLATLLALEGRRIDRLRMNCHPQNWEMQALARRFQADIVIDRRATSGGSRPVQRSARPFPGPTE